MIYTKNQIPLDLDAGKTGWVHDAKIQEFVNSYHQRNQNSQKKTYLKGGGIFTSYT